MSSLVLGFKDIDKTALKIVGGKGANLGELSRIEGISVPDGFCISTEAFKTKPMQFDPVQLQRTYPLFRICREEH